MKEANLCHVQGWRSDKSELCAMKIRLNDANKNGKIIISINRTNSLNQLTKEIRQVVQRVTKFAKLHL